LDVPMSLRYLTAGESHGKAITAILDGLPAGLIISLEGINHDLKRRQIGYGAGPRMKLEQDTVEILSGVMAGRTTGAPLALLVENRDHERWQGKEIDAFTTPRPGHADLAGAIKYGYRDLRPALERASARETVCRVAVGGICRQLLAQFGIHIGGYVSAIGEIQAELRDIPLEERAGRAAQNEINCPDPVAAESMVQRIRRVMEERDTLGGVVEVVALGLPPGLGGYAQWDRRLDARLGAAVLSIQAMKGVEIGPAFENAARTGTQTQDPIRLDGERLVRPTDRSGGLEGGVTTGQPLWIRAAMKPIATTLTPQPTVDLHRGVETDTVYERSDFCPVPRAVVIVEAVVAFVIAEALLEKLGGDSLDELLPRFEKLRRARLSDLPMDAGPHRWWPE
jgi:chorismate synthase